MNINQILMLLVVIFMEASQFMILGKQLSRQRRMVNGELAQLVNWHSNTLIVRLDGGEPRFCGGALIKSDWVITAAHCVDGVANQPEILSIRIGSTKKSLLKSYRKFHYEVKKVHLYPGYKDNGIPSDDIALLQLKYPVIINRYNFVRPISIAPWRFKKKHRFSKHCQTAGWGKEKSFESVKRMYDPNILPSQELKKIDVPILSRSRCISEFDTKNGTLLKDKQLFWDRMMCGGSRNPVLGTPCLYDSGSPLVCQDSSGRKELYGIVIAIHGPNIKTMPCTPGKQVSVFLRISHYTGWIWTTINEDDKQQYSRNLPQKSF